MPASKKIKLNKIVPDTSVIINEIVSTQLKEGKLTLKELILHKAMLAELEHLANQRKEPGFIGLDEIKTLRNLATKKKFKITYVGDRPTAGQIKYAKAGEIDALIRQTAQDLKATLISADRVQAEVGSAIGMDVLFIPFEIKEKEFALIDSMGGDAIFDEIDVALDGGKNKQGIFNI